MSVLLHIRQSEFFWFVFVEKFCITKILTTDQFPDNLDNIVLHTTLKRTKCNKKYNKAKQTNNNNNDDDDEKTKQQQQQQR